MTCCNYIIPNITKRPSVNKQLLDNVMSLPDNVRKELRLLAKQYEIVTVYKEPPIMCESVNNEKYITKENPWIIEYKHFGNSDEIFAWII